MKRVATQCVLALFALAGCVSPTYVEPISGPRAKLNVSINKSSFSVSHNVPVLVHTDRCDVESARLVGLINSKAMGIPTVEVLSFSVSADKPLSISVQGNLAESVSLGWSTGEINVRYCRSIIDVLVEPGSTYDVELDYVRGRCLYHVRKDGQLLDESSKSSRMRAECRLPFSISAGK